MKYPITKFTDLKAAIRELGPYIRNGQHLETGKPFRTLGGMRSREAVANWLICVSANLRSPDRYEFTSDPVGGDGIIMDVKTGDTWSTEHTFVSARAAGTEPAHDLIMAAISKKNSRGPTYGRGKILVVMLNAGAGRYFPNRLRNTLPGDLAFDDVWVVGLQGVDGAGRYIYDVTWLTRAYRDCPTCIVTIEPGFDAWGVRQIQ